VFDIISGFQVVADGGFEESQFYYITPQTKNKREMPENQGKTPSFPLTSCPEPAGQVLRFLVDADGDHSLTKRRRAINACCMP